MDLKSELEGFISKMEPEIEGLADFARLNLAASTKSVITATTQEFNTRMALMKAALKTLLDLDSNRYPDSPIRPVAADVFKDLQGNVQTISAAFAKFAPPEEAATVNIIPGTPQPSYPPTSDSQ